MSHTALRILLSQTANSPLTNCEFSLKIIRAKSWPLPRCNMTRRTRVWCWFSISGFNNPSMVSLIVTCCNLLQLDCNLLQLFLKFHHISLCPGSSRALWWSTLLLLHRIVPFLSIYGHYRRFRNFQLGSRVKNGPFSRLLHQFEQLGFATYELPIFLGEIF